MHGQAQSRHRGHCICSGHYYHLHYLMRRALSAEGICG